VLTITNFQGTESSEILDVRNSVVVSRLIAYNNVYYTHINNNIIRGQFNTDGGGDDGNK